MEDCILVELFGGLGNQLFQYAAGRALSIKWQKPLFLTKETENKHNGKEFDYRKELGLSGIHLDFSTREIPRVSNMNMVYQEDGFAAWNPDEYRPPLLLRGYFQYLPAIQDSLSLISSEINQSLSERRETMKRKYNITEKSVFLHVRRGDYLNHPDFHYVQTIEYYATAFKKLIDAIGSYPNTICIFSDDYNWVRQQKMFEEMPNKVYVEENEIDSFAAMLECKGGAILGNSTFSWWGAKMGADLVSAPIFYPSRWIAKPIFNLFPQRWMAIE